MNVTIKITLGPKYQLEKYYKNKIQTRELIFILNLFV